MSNAPHVAAGVQHARVRAHAKTHAGKPHQRRSVLQFPNGTRVVDRVTGRGGVVLSGAMAHVLDPRAPRRASDAPTFSLKVPPTVRVDTYAVELDTRETVSRTADQLVLAARGV